MSIIMQIWGGVLYLFNKIFLSVAERSEKKNPENKTWRIYSWVTYLLGTPPWIIIFIWERNWIAAALEAGGIPSMILGLTIALKGKGKEPKWLNYIAFFAIVIGLGYSLYDFRGITTVNQVLELFVVSGFLVGTYLLAQKKTFGYVCFMFMNSTCAVLMWVENYPWLVVQQIISLAFVIDAYRTRRQQK